MDTEMIARPSAEEFARIAYRKFLAGIRADVATLDANYLRRSDAEIFSEPKPGTRILSHENSPCARIRPGAVDGHGRGRWFSRSLDRAAMAGYLPYGISGAPGVDCRPDRRPDYGQIAASGAESGAWGWISGCARRRPRVGAGKHCGAAGISPPRGWTRAVVSPAGARPLAAGREDFPRSSGLQPTSDWLL